MAAQLSDLTRTELTEVTGGRQRVKAEPTDARPQDYLMHDQMCRSLVDAGVSESDPQRMIICGRAEELRVDLLNHPPKK